MKNFPTDLGRFIVHYASFADNYLSKGRHLCVYVTKDSDGVSRQFALPDDAHLAHDLSKILQITPTESRLLLRAAREQHQASKSRNFIPAGKPVGV